MKNLAEELNDALARQHILEGRQIALLRRDELLYWISSADDPIKKLMSELPLTEAQAKDILSLNLGYFKRLVALDVESELLNLQRNLPSNEQIARIRDISKPKQPQCRIVRESDCPPLPVPPKRQSNQISIESYDNPFFKLSKENE
jgi:DNA gyrase/topoisomerase IV subunit A